MGRGHHNLVNGGRAGPTAIFPAPGQYPGYTRGPTNAHTYAAASGHATARSRSTTGGGRSAAGGDSARWRA